MKFQSVEPILALPLHPSLFLRNDRKARVVRHRYQVKNGFAGLLIKLTWRITPQYTSLSSLALGALDVYYFNEKTRLDVVRQVQRG